MNMIMMNFVSAALFETLCSPWNI